MKLLAQATWPNLSAYFLATVPDGFKMPYEDTKSDAALNYIRSIPYSVLRLTHVHGTENDADFKYHNGNSDPRGYGHLGFIVDDVDAFCDVLIAQGVPFQKKPTDGMMRNIAFALDPDNYWVEILPRSKVAPPTAIVGKPSFQQTMIRIKDPKVSVPFYEKLFGCTTVAELHFPQAKFSLYFLGTIDANEKIPADPKSSEAKEYMNSISGTLLELTHNHGTESDDSLKYHSGNEDPKGFQHLGFLCDDLEARCESLEKEHGVKFTKRPSEGHALAEDPDGYQLEIIQRFRE